MKIVNSIVVVFAGLMAFVFVPAHVRATPLFAESFNYQVGSNLVGQKGGTGFSGPWAISGGSDVDFVSSPGLTYPGYSSVGGAATSSPATTQSPFRYLSTIYGTPGTVQWASFLVNEVSAAPGDGNQFGGIDFGNLFVGGGAGSGLNTNWGMNTSGYNPATSTTIPVVQGQMTLLVLRLAYASGNTDIQLFVDPSLGTTPTTPDAEKTDLDLLFNYIGFQHRDSMWAIDEVRYGNNFSDVVPEPSMAGLIGLASVPLVLRRKKSEIKVDQ
jgi:hypothetical protein